MAYSRFRKYRSYGGYRRPTQSWAVRRYRGLLYKMKKARSRRAKTAYRNRVRTNPEARKKYIGAQQRKIARFLGVTGEDGPGGINYVAGLMGTPQPDLSVYQ